MTCWEYRFVRVQLGDRDDASAAADELDALGADGWEAVGFSPAHASGHGLSVHTTQYVVLLKREREPA
jgi:hypothetical protein